MGLSGGKYLVVINAQKDNYPHYNNFYNTNIPLRQFWYPCSLSRNQKNFYFLQIPPFLVTINTLNRESNLSSFSFRDIFLLSASESFRVTSLETASSLFCATLKGKEKEFPHAPGVNSALSETLCTPSLSWQLYHTLHFKKTSWTESSKLITLY